MENVDTETILLGFAKFCKVAVTMEMDVGSAKDVLSDGEYEKAETCTWKPDSVISVDARIAARQELDEDGGKTYMSVGIGKAELKVKYIVVVMYDGDGVNSESGDNEFNSVNVNTKGGEVIKNGYKYINPLHILSDFNNM